MQKSSNLLYFFTAFYKILTLQESSTRILATEHTCKL